MRETTTKAPEGFRLRRWEYPKGTTRRGLICNGCGYCADPDDPAAAGQAELDAAAARHTCPAPEYEWDHWHRRARAAGVDPDLAELGRQVVREAYNHGWDVDLKAVCGWGPDRGAAMVRFALAQPAAARRRWNHLMETDGERGRWVRGEWVPRC